MILFTFTVRDAFIKYDRHPITIPKKYYGDLLKEQIISDNSQSVDCLITCPDGRKLAGQIYKGKAGYGIFYQICVRGGQPSDHLDHLQKGQNIFVAIKRVGNKVIVKIVDHIDEIVGNLLKQNE